MNNNERLQLPHTNDPEVMHRAVAASLLHLCWDEVIRTADLDHLDDKAVEIYLTIYKGIAKAF
ncbi:MAG: hypothetical protein ABI780_05085 [Ardenticatenales bacterium]